MNRASGILLGISSLPSEYGIGSLGKPFARMKMVDAVKLYSGVDFDKINVGCTVKAYDITFDEEIEFKLVGSTEANSLEGKISNESPVGHALIGKTIGDVVEVETQAGVMQYKVLDITRTV